MIIDQHFSETILRAINYGKHWAFAISGGADSLGLFYIIENYIKENFFDIKLSLIVVNHNLRPETKQEIEFLNRIATFHNIKLIVLNWNHQNKIEGNLYDNARKNRYKIIIEYCQNNRIQVLFTAHHLNDQIETFKMRLKKGMGIDGLSCIREMISLNNLIILRPLLEIKSRQIRKYMSENNQLWIEDRTNYNMNYTRPQIRQNNDFEIFDKNISLLTKKFFLANTALEYYEELEFKNICTTFDGKIYFDSQKFIKLPIEISLRILKRVFIGNISGGARRILFDELLKFRKDMLKLLFESKYTLQFSNFNVSYAEYCFVFEKQGQKNS